MPMVNTVGLHNKCWRRELFMFIEFKTGIFLILYFGQVNTEFGVLVTNLLKKNNKKKKNPHYT